MKTPHYKQYKVLSAVPHHLILQVLHLNQLNCFKHLQYTSSDSLTLLRTLTLHVTLHVLLLLTRHLKADVYLNQDVVPIA